MPPQPQIVVLPTKTRFVFFWVLVLVFLVALPSLIFYTSGNRLIFGDEETSIVSMGGIYLGNELTNIEVYIDEKQIEKSRLFRRALYLEDIAAGKHRVHVQGNELQTWVKELPVFPYIVTESYSFNLPAKPQIRLVTEYVDVAGLSVVRGVSSTTALMSHASITNPVLLTKLKATSTWEVNPEYTYLTELFSTATKTDSLWTRWSKQQVEPFQFSSALLPLKATSTATTTVERQNIRLAEEQGEIIATWIGPKDTTPYYFCVSYDIASTTALRYGSHVAKDIEEELTESEVLPNKGDRFCRQSIRIDRDDQDVYFFDFLPQSVDLVLLHLTDGLYVTEIDDRAWQNIQLLYPGKDLRLLVDNDQILVLDQGRYFEVQTTIDDQL